LISLEKGSRTNYELVIHEFELADEDTD